MNAEGSPLPPTFHVLRLTFHASRFTLHASRFTSYVSRFTFHVSRLTFQALIAATLILSPVHRFKTLGDRPIDLIYDDYINFQLFVADIPMFAAAGLWLLSVVLAPRPIAVGSRWIALAFLGIWLLGLAGTTWSADPALSLYHLVRLAALAAFALAVAEFGSLSVVAGASAMMIVSQSAVGLAQWFEQHSLGLVQLGERVLDPAKLGTSVVLGGGTRLLRAYGLSDHPNLLGGCLAFALIVIVGALAARSPSRAGDRMGTAAPTRPDETRRLGDEGTGSGQSASPPWTRSMTVAARIPALFGLAVALAVGSAALIVTFSRSAWIGLAVGLAVLAVLCWLGRWPKRDLVLPVAGLALGFFLIAPAVLPAFTGRLQAPDGSPRTEERSIAERSNLTRAAWDLIQRRPLLGVGLGTFPIAHLREDPDFPDNFVPVHNILLAATAETGLVGGLLYFTLLAAPLVLAFRSGRRLSAAGLTATAGLAAVIAVGMFDYYPWLLVPGRIWFFIFIGLWIGGVRASVPVVFASFPGLSKTLG